MRRVYKNVCPTKISASIMAANMWKNSLKNVESDNNKTLYEILFDFFTGKRYLLSECRTIHMLHKRSGVRTEASYGMSHVVSYPGTDKVFYILRMV